MQDIWTPVSLGHGVRNTSVWLLKSVAAAIDPEEFAFFSCILILALQHKLEQVHFLLMKIYLLTMSK